MSAVFSSHSQHCESAIDLRKKSLTGGLTLLHVAVNTKKKDTTATPSHTMEAQSLADREGVGRRVKLWSTLV